MWSSVLQRILYPERYQQRAAQTGFSTPVLQEIRLGEDALPLLASNMRGGFVPTRRSSEGNVRYGFSHCPLEDEPRLFESLFDALVTQSVKGRWGNRAATVSEGLARCRERGLQPRFIVIPDALLPEVVGASLSLDDAYKAQRTRGYATVIEDMQVLLADLPSGNALVSISPREVGCYTRVGDHLGILVQRVDRNLVMVGRDLA
jgi:hypothetical protein